MEKSDSSTNIRLRHSEPVESKQVFHLVGCIELASGKDGSRIVNKALQRPQSKEDDEVSVPVCVRGSRHGAFFFALLTISGHKLNTRRMVMGSCVVDLFVWTCQ